MTAKVPEDARGRPWSVDLGRAKTGSFEDRTVEVLEGVVPSPPRIPGG